MTKYAIFPWLVALLFLVPSSVASGPHVTDAVGDAPEGHLDIVSATISNDEDMVSFVIQMRDLSFPDPVANGDFRSYYQLRFTVTGVEDPVIVEGIIHYVDVRPGLMMHCFLSDCRTVGYGSTFHGRSSTWWFNGYVTLDRDLGTVTIDVLRNYTYHGIRHSIPDDAVVSGITVLTFAGETPLDAPPGTHLSTGAERRLVDTAGPGSSYTIG